VAGRPRLGNVYDRGRSVKGVKESEGDRAGRLGYRPHRELVLSADGGGDEATTAEG
jgi:hypothetical protein